MIMFLQPLPLFSTKLLMFFLSRHCEWFDLPASYHNGAASLSFADGHAVSHRWRHALTKQPPRKSDVPLLPLPFPKEESEDFDWLMARMSEHVSEVNASK